MSRPIDIDDEQYARALKVTCPYCHARPGEACWSHYHDVEVAPHSVRRFTIPDPPGSGLAGDAPEAVGQ